MRYIPFFFKKLHRITCIVFIGVIFLKRKSFNFLKNGIFEFFIGVGISLIITFLAVAAAALFIKAFDPDSLLISVGAVIIKFISVFFGAFYVGTKKRKKGVLWGGLTALAYFVICFALSCVFSGAFEISYTVIPDILLTVFAGCISGIISVNIMSA